MLPFFRRLTHSKFGLAIVALFLVAISAGFVITDLKNFEIGGGGDTTTVAKIGSEKVTASELGQRVQRQLDSIRRQQPDLTIQRLVSEGGVEQILDQYVDGVALQRFAETQGMVISRKLEDGQIASIPSFKSFDGKVDRALINQFLVQSRMTEKQFRQEIARDLISTQLLLPVTGAARASLGYVMPYASMLLEAREGHLGFVPASAIKPGPAPSDADIVAYFQRNTARYSIPERRTVRYAMISREALGAAAQPTEAEVAKYYKDNQSKYAANETRKLTQLIVPDEATAKKIAAQIAGGASLDAAAKAAGFEAAVLDKQTRSGFAGATSAAIADAAFSTPAGKLLAPAKTALGWHIVRVDAVEGTPARSLDQARSEIVDVLKKQKADQLLSDAIAKIEDSISDGSTFDEVVQANHLTAAKTKPLFAGGVDPDAPTAAVSPEIAVIAKAGFASEIDDDPTVEQVVPNDSFALIDLESITPAAPPALAAIRERVVQEMAVDRALAEGRKIADAVAGKLNGGTPLAQAFAGAGIPLPAPAPIGGKRQDVLQQTQRPKPELALLFSMPAHKAKVLEAPDRTGWYIVYLDNIQQGDARGRPDLLSATQAQFSQVLAQEYAQQFLGATRAEMKATRNVGAIEKLKRDLLGGASQ
jgi:peptidyl-prolyl cis-trans isomerase D